MKKAICSALASAVLVIMFTGCGGGSHAVTPPPVVPPVVPPPAVISFVAGPTLPSGGTRPVSLVIADFDGDGKQDIAVSNSETNTLAVFLNTGAAAFGDPVVTTVPIPNGLGSISVGDFNEDGKPDIVAATISGPQANIVFLGNGDGTFQQQPPILNSFGFFHARVVDLNGDHHQDLVLGANGNISVSLGRGDGTFVDTVQLQSGSFPGSYLGITVADFNGDGKLDIAAADLGYVTGGTGTLVFYAGKGDGTFEDPTSADLLATAPGSLSSGDFDGDGKQDLFVGFPNAGFITYGNGDGTFDLHRLTSAYGTDDSSFTGGVIVQASDLDGDGKEDAVTIDYKFGVLQLTMNAALGKAVPNDGTFPFTLSPGLSEIAVGDLNGDGIQDVAVTNAQTNQVNIVLSRKE